MGPIGLHGGAEYVSGDEPFLAALLGAAPRRAGDGAVRVVVVPTAAAGGSPDRAGSTGVEGFERVARSEGIAAHAEVVLVVDAASAADRRLVERIAGADVIHLPGGDPAIIPGILPGTDAWQAVRTAWSGGAVLAGASAGAMALADWVWTPTGGVTGLGLVGGLVVMPHFEQVRQHDWRTRLAAIAPPSVGFLGLDEQTGVLSEPVAGTSGGRWRTWGPGAVHWFAPGAAEPSMATRGEVIELADVSIREG